MNAQEAYEKTMEKHPDTATWVKKVQALLEEKVAAGEFNLAIEIPIQYSRPLVEYFGQEGFHAAVYIENGAYSFEMDWRLKLVSDV
jgi:hypothetical protein